MRRLDNEQTSLYHTTMNDLLAGVQNQLQTLFPGSLQHVSSCWERSEWSKIYRLDLRDGTRVFLKGTPRSRNEALVTQRLSELCPACIPQVLIADLNPLENWRWFLMEDAGQCNMSTLVQSTALEAVRKLGCLQKRTLGDQLLPSLVAHCEGSHLQQLVLDVCSWAMSQQETLGVVGDLQRITSHIEEAHSFFDKLEQDLSELPSTIVHGDFWSGNIAVAKGNVRFVDWGDALWGVSGISLVNLIMTSDSFRDKAAPTLWEAYEQGWERSISQSYREACVVASDIADLVIDRAIVSSVGQGPARLPGLLPGLLDIEDLIAKQLSC